jgi:uncharacterized protein (TIGR03435 family)
MKFCIVALLLCMAIGHAQSPVAGPKFEVASIRLSDCDFSKFAGRGSSPGRINLKCAHLRDLIQQAYGRFRFNPLRDQVTGGPGWLDSDFYDIVAKADSEASRTQMAGPMMQTLLEDRFRLKIHREPKEVPVYELTVGKGGSKLQPARGGNCIVPDPDHPPAPQAPGYVPIRSCGGRYETGHGFDMYDATVANLCEALSFKMDRDVIDKTGIQGKFDIHVEINPDNVGTGAVVPAASGGSNDAGPPAASDPRSMLADLLHDIQKTNEGVLGPALQQQLGLKIESGKGPGETIVIDHIERPTQN